MDGLKQMIKETQIAMANMDPSDCDEREAILQTCGLTLAAIKDPGERLSQATNYAILLALRCAMRSSKALAVVNPDCVVIEITEEEVRQSIQIEISDGNAISVPAGGRINARPKPGGIERIGSTEVLIEA